MSAVLIYWSDSQAHQLAVSTQGVAAEQERSEGNETIEGECRLPSSTSLLFRLPLRLIRASAPFADTHTIYTLKLKIGVDSAEGPHQRAFLGLRPECAGV